MAIELIMPKQGQSVESCIISKWYKKKFDIVKKGEVLFEYETDKASFEEDSPVDGYLIEILYNEGDEVKVLNPVCYIGEKNEKVPIKKIAAKYKENDISKTVGFQEKNNQSNNVTFENINSDMIMISPRAKKIAELNHINYFNITGSGPRGRIIEKDIASIIAGKSKSTPLARKIAEIDKMELPLTGSGNKGRILKSDVLKPFINDIDFELRELSNFRKIVANRMLESIQNTAQLTLHSSADASQLINQRKIYKSKSVNITINDMICFAVIRALLLHPEMNAHLEGSTLKIFKNIHLGIAVDTARGLIVPVIKNAHQLSLEDLSATIKSVATKCQQGSFDPSILEGASFTVTNLGTLGIDYFTPILNVPQIGILGVGSIIQKPAELKDGSIGFISCIALSLTFDHRATDGANAARFLQDINNQLQQISNLK
jgi:pyruvate dehydrogenase E2 component (dihydrolipoamide acetyltransferase)